jgi:hypothetical protein
VLFVDALNPVLVFASTFRQFRSIAFGDPVATEFCGAAK